MAVCRCKMCGGELVITDGQEIAYCESCGTKQTLPRISSDQMSRLLEKANALRMSGDFDKALDVYDKITDEEESSDPEIYWNKVICKYGVQYVEENGKRIPTVNRAQYDSVFDDLDYKKCISIATLTTRELYESEAKTIDNIQRGILEISSQQEPFDIFISYKETDPITNQRTQDSEDCYEMYHLLTNKGYKVFFSRFSLKQVAGSAYEPHIFAALQSAKVMLLYGSDIAYFEAPWVRNEWSRFLTLCKKNPQNKRLIPCYKGIDPGDLPKEIRNIQGIDFSKIGAEGNLISILEKTIKKETSNFAGAATTQSGNAQANALVGNAKIFIKQKDYENAKTCLNSARNLDPGNWEIYLCGLLIDYQLTGEEELKDLSATFEDNFNYKQIMQFGDDNIKKVISSYNNYISEQNKLKKDSEIYKDAEALFKDSNLNDKLNSAKKLYRSISGYKDSAEKEKECIAKIHDNIVNIIDTSKSVSELNQAMNDCDFISEDFDTTEMKEAIDKSIILETQRGVYNNKLATIPMVNQAISALAPILDYADAAALKRGLEEKRHAIEVAIRRAKRYSAISAIFVACVVVCVLCIGSLLATIALSGPKEEVVNDKGYEEKLVKYRLNGAPQVNKKIKYKGNWITTDNHGYLNMNRWVEEGADFGFYKENGERAQNEFMTIRDKDYYFNKKGNIIYDKFVKDDNLNKERYLGKDGYVVKNQIVTHGAKNYYLDENGCTRQEGWGKNNDDEFYTQSDGSIIQSQFMEKDKKQIYLNADGLIAKNAWSEVDGKMYHSRSDGALEEGGLKEIEGKKFYFNDDHSLVIDEYKDCDGKQRYFTKEGMAVGGLFYVKGVLHFFDNDGNPAQDWQKVNMQNGEVWVYCEADGRCVVKQAKEIKGDIYYFDENGVMLTNTTAGGLCLQSDGKAIRNTWYGDFYYGSNGYKVVNAETPDGFYVGADGRIIKNGWVANNTMWSDSNGRISRNCWVDNNQSYVGDDGHFVSNTTIDGRFINAKGIYQPKALSGDFELYDVSRENSETKSYTKYNSRTSKNETTEVQLKFNKVHQVKVKPNTTAFDGEANALRNALSNAYSSIKSKAISSCNSNWESFILRDWRITGFDDSTITVTASGEYVTNGDKNKFNIKIYFNRNSKSYSMDSYSFS